MNRIDLQAHSTVSDGVLPPAEVVRLAAKAGVEVFALSDHDAVDGLEDASREAKRVGIELIPAVELSTAHPEVHDLHMLGYRIDIEDESLQKALELAQNERVERAHKISNRLAVEGVQLSVDAALEVAGGAIALGRPHIATAALENPANKVVLEGVGDKSTFIRRYLVPGCSSFVARTWPTVSEAIELVHRAGGSAVWAHPFWDIDNFDEVAAVLDELREAGLDGVEAFYPSHSRAHTAFLLDECRKYGLVATASSDFHGPDHRHFSGFLTYDTYGLGEPQVPPK